MTGVKRFLPYRIARRIAAYEPSYLWWSLPQIVTSSALPLLAVHVPKRILEVLTEGASIELCIAAILFYGGVLLLLRMLDAFLAAHGDLAAARFSARLRLEVAKTVTQLELQDMETSTRRTAIAMAGNAAALPSLLACVKQMVANGITVVGYAWIAVRVNVAFPLAILAVLGVKVWFSHLQFRFNKKARVLYAENDRVGDYLMGLAYLNAGAQKELRLNASENWFMGKILGYREKMLQLQYKDFRRYALFESVMACLVAGQSLMVLWILAERYADGAIGIADFTMYFSAVTALTAALGAFTQQIRAYREQALNFTDYERLTELLDAKRAAEQGSVAPIRGSRATVVFEDVTFAYPDTDKNVLEHLNLTVSSGERLMLVGRNGSGKTTLVKLLSKFYRPTSGRITLNGRDIWEIPDRAYYRALGAVFQDCKSFAFTLAENVSVSESPDRERLKSVFREIGLWEWIDALPAGMDTHLTRQFSSDGVEASGGQEQKLAIARALVKDAPLLILDEPTASLDAKAECGIYSDFERMARGKTVILISHRLAAAYLADRIVVLENGRVAESGTHKTLMERNGLYAEMYTKQSRPYHEAPTKG